MTAFGPELAHAHSFGRMYNLPVPFWMYAYGAAAALLLSFLLLGYFVAHGETRKPFSRDLSGSAFVRALRRTRLLPILRAFSVLMLALCLLTGFFGNRNPYVNFSMTFFWVIFVLCFAYVTALIGDLYAAINPWRVLADWISRAWRSYATGRVQYPARLAYWPALALYMGFIWIELFGFSRPFSLAAWLLAYSILNLVGVWLVGVRDWFRYCEFFSVLLRLLAKMAPLDYVAREDGKSARLRLRVPFAGLLEDRAESLSLVVFSLFMLSSTAFDGLRATVPWFRLFWGDPFGIIRTWVGTHPIYAYPKLRSFYIAWETTWLLLSPFAYLALYGLFVWLAKVLARSRLSLYDLCLRFAFSLLPIVLVYNITHYYTLVLTQGLKVVSLFSDPFGWGWNLFGTAMLMRAPILPDMGLVWHSQVGLILFGHIVSVYLAHVEALRTFPTRRAALLSQLPMLILMVVFTTVGLWILAQPIQSGM